VRHATLPMPRFERAYGRALLLRANGMSITAIAQQIGVARTTVGGWLRGHDGYSEIRECRLCGDPFTPNSGAQRFCTRAHADKHYRVFVEPRRPAALRQRAAAIEAELRRLRARIDDEEQR
jgi:Homeodomain-like domain